MVCYLGVVLSVFKSAQLTEAFVMPLITPMTHWIVLINAQHSEYAVN